MLIDKLGIMHEILPVVGEAGGVEHLCRQVGQHKGHLVKILLGSGVDQVHHLGADGGVADLVELEAQVVAHPDGHAGDGALDGRRQRLEMGAVLRQHVVLHTENKGLAGAQDALAGTSVPRKIIVLLQKGLRFRSVRDIHCSLGWHPQH